MTAGAFARLPDSFLHNFRVWTVPRYLLRIRGELAIGAHLRAQITVIPGEQSLKPPAAGPRVCRLSTGAREIRTHGPTPNASLLRAPHGPPLLPVSESRPPEKRHLFAELSATAISSGDAFIHVGVPNAHTPIALSSYVEELLFAPELSFAEASG
jgi:hypothetical protein